MTSVTSSCGQTRFPLVPDGTGASCLLDLTPGVAARQLAKLDWDFARASSDERTHALHPYPAKFVPALPRQVIAALSRPGDVVLDPFAGGGTSAVEALAARRGSYAIDANPVGVAITRAKTTALATSDLAELQRLEAALLGLSQARLARDEPAWLPDIPNTTKWYDPLVLRALGIVRALIMEVSPQPARELALVAFVQAAARLSYQDSETRYSSRPRRVDVVEVPRAVIAELRRMRRIVESADPFTRSQHATVVEGDARDAVAYDDVQNESVGLVVTSPPYPNAYDYHLYHRFRLFWLGCDPKALRKVEIGSHLKNQSIADPIATYVDDMTRVLSNCARVLAPGRWLAIVVGDGLFHGEVFNTAVSVASVGADVGLDHVVTIDRALPVNRRSVTKAGRRLTQEQIVFLRRPASARASLVVPPNYALFPYERELQRRELSALGGSPQIRANGSIQVTSTRDVLRAAFVHGVQRPDTEFEPSLQMLVERADARQRRKNSTYFAHGLHRFKGKFYPQLAKALMNLSGIEPGHSLVVDPFGGSGTVALEGTLQGFDVVTIDCNPLATAIAEAKLSLIAADPRETDRLLDRVTSLVRAAPSNGSSELTEFAPQTMPELERWFPAPVLSKLNWLLTIIRGESRPGFLDVLVSDIIREISQQEPKDLRIRRRSAPIDDAPVYELFLSRVEETRRRLNVFWADALWQLQRIGSGQAILGSSADPKTFGQLGGRRIDAVVSSPPYAAALPYIDTDRLSLAAVFGISSSERRSVEGVMIGSREISERSRAAHESQFTSGMSIALPASTVSFLNAYRDAVEADPNAGFRRRQAPAVLHRYFCSMSDVLSNLREHMDRATRCWFVLGDSRSTIGGKSWRIPTVDEVASIADTRGFRVADRMAITVTREDVLHSRNAITKNVILQLAAD